MIIIIIEKKHTLKNGITELWETAPMNNLELEKWTLEGAAVQHTFH